MGIGLVQMCKKIKSVGPAYMIEIKIIVLESC